MSSTSEIIKLITQIKGRNVFALIGSGGSGTGEPAITPGTVAQYWRGDKTFQPLNKAAVGLSNVDNVADIDKPIGTATAGALAAKLDATHAGTGGTAHAAVVAAGAAGFMSGADKTKLDGVAAGATANSADATLLNRANHTGTQALGTISGMAAGVSAFLAAPTSSNMAAMLTDETGTGSNVFGTSPTLNSPILAGTTYMQQGAQTSLAAAATLTIAQLLTGIIQYTGAAATLTLPTGALIDAGILAGTAVDRAFEFIVINTGTGIATLATATGLTLVGSMAVTNGTSARFRVRKTAASTFTVYRV